MFMLPLQVLTGIVHDVGAELDARLARGQRQRCKGQQPPFEPEFGRISAHVNGPVAVEGLVPVVMDPKRGKL
eukprot:SAG11_NODE_12365_length_707_cov_0.629934_2_plen_72_part_00